MAPRIFSRSKQFCIAISLIWLASCLGLGSTANVQYKAASGVTSRMLDVKEVKDVTWKNLDQYASDTEYFMGKKHKRFVRNVANETITNGPYNSTTLLNSTTRSSTPPSRTNFSEMTPTSIPQNRTEISFHKYYTTKFFENSNYFTDLKALYGSRSKFVTKESLKSGRPHVIRYTEKKLQFKFPFYGHSVDRVVVNAAGFLHIGPVVHMFMDDVHYLAPLMGDFFSNVTRPVIVYIWSNKEKFIVQWDSVLEAKSKQAKPFTFQVTLYENGTIIFGYKSIPYNIKNFVRKDYPPKVGLADGYIVIEYYKIVAFGRIVEVPINTIYRYHTVALNQESVKSYSSFVLTPIPNCIQAKTCDTCFSDVIARNFQCKWCNKLKLCSDTFDWHRQKWMKNGCNKDAYNSQSKCSTSRKSHSKKKVVGLVVGLLVAVIVICVAIALFYGYRNPTSKLGLVMIQYRPSKIFSRSK